ncbi:MAG: hypothetical protein VR65_19820 [Desulfobulbaceae bacterium BRH_c16a]|nr:MAG: hypothetical protein VR65_19820 [Desulfobulbaceae bacterium BRH_c16a]
MQEKNDNSASRKCDNGIHVRLKSFRVEKELTQKDIALALDLDPAAVSRIEKNERQIDCYSFLKLREEFSVDINWLLTGEKDTLQKCENHKFDFLADLQTWLEEICTEEPERQNWLKIELKDKLPLFNEWLKKRDQATAKAGDRRAA